MSIVTATQNVWATKDGRLVSDGSKDAICLIARIGTRLPFDRVKTYPEANRFFCGIHEKRPATGEEPERPKRKYTLHSKE